MIRNVLIKLFELLVLIVVTIFILFFILAYIPGNEETHLLAAEWIAADQLEYITKPDGSKYTQFIGWVKNITHLTLGTSYTYQMSVFFLIKKSIIYTLLFSFLSIIFSYSFGIIAGFILGLTENCKLSKLLWSTFAIILGMPEFLIAAFCIYWLQSFSHGIELSSNFIYIYVIPALIAGISTFLHITKITYTAIIKIAQTKYFLTAKAKGLPNHIIYLKHMMKNVLAIVASYVKISLATIISLSILIERLFNCKGIGNLIYEAIVCRDYKLISAGVIIGCVLVAIGGIISDCLLMYMDPRQRMRKQKLYGY